MGKIRQEMKTMPDDTLFDANALMQWETDGGFVPDHYELETPETQEESEREPKKSDAV